MGPCSSPVLAGPIRLSPGRGHRFDALQGLICGGARGSAIRRGATARRPLQRESPRRSQLQRQKRPDPLRRRSPACLLKPGGRPCRIGSQSTSWPGFHPPLPGPTDPDEKQMAWSGSTAGAAIAPCDVPDKSPCNSNRYANSTAMAVADILSRSMSRRECEGADAFNIAASQKRQQWVRKQRLV